MTIMFSKILVVSLFFAVGLFVNAQKPAIASEQSCPLPFPSAKFFIEEQPDSPLLIRDLTAELVQNPNDLMGYKSIRVTFYFENRSTKKITDIIWDDPSPDESEEASGGINSQGLLPGESLRESIIFHTQNGPPIVFRITKINFADGRNWKAGQYNKTKALKTKVVCVVPEKWPNIQLKRSLLADGWRTPIFSDRVTRTIDAEPQVIDGVKILSNLYEIRRERLETVQGCAPDGMFERIIGKDREFDFDVEKYRSFSIKGKIFAYLINYEYIDDAGQYEIGATSSSFYVDNEGSGKFTLQCDKGNTIPPIPLWAKKLGRSK